MHTIIFVSMAFEVKFKICVHFTYTHTYIYSHILHKGLREAYMEHHNPVKRQKRKPSEV